MKKQFLLFFLLLPLSLASLPYWQGDFADVYEAKVSPHKVNEYEENLKKLLGLMEQHDLIHFPLLTFQDASSPHYTFIYAIKELNDLENEKEEWHNLDMKLPSDHKGLHDAIISSRTGSNCELFAYKEALSYDGDTFLIEVMKTKTLVQHVTVHVSPEKAALFEQHLQNKIQLAKAQNLGGFRVYRAMTGDNLPVYSLYTKEPLESWLLTGAPDEVILKSEKYSLYTRPDLSFFPKK